MSVVKEHSLSRAQHLSRHDCRFICHTKPFSTHRRVLRRYYLQSYLTAPARSGALKFGVVSDPLSTTGLRRECYETGMSVLGSAGLQPAA